MSRLVLLLAVLACLAWAGAVAYEAWAGWPHLSLDLSHSDPSTQEAHGRAVIVHLVSHAAAGLAPLAVVGAVATLVRRRK